MAEVTGRASDAATERGFVIERYVYTNRRGNDSGVQWLVHEERDGNRHLVKVCKTRREAKAYVRTVL